MRDIYNIAKFEHPQILSFLLKIIVNINAANNVKFMYHGNNDL